MTLDHHGRDFAEAVRLHNLFLQALREVTDLIDGNDGWGYDMVGEQMITANPLVKWLGPNEDYTKGRVRAEHLKGMYDLNPNPGLLRSKYGNHNEFRLAMRRTYRAARDVADHPQGLDAAIMWKLAEGGAQ